MEIFRDDEQGYLNWIATHRDGFVLNSRSNPSPAYLVLHKATCGHISGHTVNYAPNAFTGKDYIKVCSKKIEEIKAWAASIGGRQFSGVCRDCQPEINRVFSETIQNAAGNKQPRAVLTQTLTYQRDQSVVRATLERAKGVCERCGQSAPFIRKSDNKPYLEVHHRVPLSQGGEDKLENAEALCPNCHREAHHG